MKVKLDQVTTTLLSVQLKNESSEFCKNLRASIKEIIDDLTSKGICGGDEYSIEVEFDKADYEYDIKQLFNNTFKTIQNRSSLTRSSAKRLHLVYMQLFPGEHCNKFLES